MRQLAMLIVFAVVVFVGVVPARAQDGPVWVEIRSMTVRADCIDEWRAVQRDAIGPALRDAGVPWREAWQTVFGPTRRFTFVTPIENFAQYEEEQAGLAIPAHAAAVARRCNMDHQVEAMLLQPDLSHMLDDGPPPNIAFVTSEEIAPGRRAEWQELIRSEVLPAVDQSNTLGLHIFSAVFGGVERFVQVNFRDGMPALDAGSTLQQAFGREAGNQVAERRRGLTAHTERWVIRFVPELSYGRE